VWAGVSTGGREKWRECPSKRSLNLIGIGGSDTCLTARFVQRQTNELLALVSMYELYAQ
jgi:hypothetical protein